MTAVFTLQFDGGGLGGYNKDGIAFRTLAPLAGVFVFNAELTAAMFTTKTYHGFLPRKTALDYTIASRLSETSCFTG